MKLVPALAVLCWLFSHDTEAQLAEGESNPRIDGHRVTFYAEARDGQPPRLVGDLNWWGRYPGAATMEPVPGTSWYTATAELAPAARIEYGFVYSEGDPVLDPRNPKTTRTFGQTRSVVEMPEYAPSPFVETGGPLAGSVQSFTTAGDRRVHVYLPPGYPDEASYPVVYFHDGTPYIEEVGSAAILENMIRANAIRPVIGVFVDPLDRSAEYRGDPAFLDFFVKELVPRIDETYPTLATAAGRAVVGGSRGALGAATLAWGSNGVFGFCGMLAPAITPADFLSRLFEGPARPFEVYMVGGTYDVRFIGDYHTALDAFLANGYRVTAREVPIGHSPTSWRHYLPEMLTGFFPPS